jgi:hypothetical protein
MGCWNYSIYFSIFKIALILYFWIFHKFFKGENIQIFPKGKKRKIMDGDRILIFLPLVYIHNYFHIDFI